MPTSATRDIASIYRPPIVFAGMHRSGTSFVASFVREAGIDMGARLLEASRGNELGHFENAEFVGFHQRQLVLHGYDAAGWITPGGLVPDGPAIAEAVAIVASNGRSGPWGWKDPRTSLFLDFWLSIVPEAYFVFIYREPAEVVDSLFRRGDKAISLSPEMAVHAWLSHNWNLLNFCRAHRSRCILANIAAVVENPQAFLQLVATRFAPEIDTEVSSPFDESLMHVALTDSPLPALLRHFVPECGALFDQLEDEADLRGTPQHHRKDATRSFIEFWRARSDPS